MRSRIIDTATGLAKLRPYQGDKITRPHKEKHDTTIQICLSCTERKCNGNCKRIKEGQHEKG